MNAKNLLIVQSFLLFVLIVVVSVGIFLDQSTSMQNAQVVAAAQSNVPTLAAISSPTPIPPTATLLPTTIPATPMPPTPAAPTQWEYLSVSYSQFQTDMGNLSSPRYEIIAVDTEPYATQFADMMFEGCDMGSSGFPVDTDCMVDNFQGRQYYLNLLGQDGWELIQVDNQSTEFTYQVEMLFKRPINP